MQCPFDGYAMFSTNLVLCATFEDRKAALLSLRLSVSMTGHFPSRVLAIEAILLSLCAPGKEAAIVQDLKQKTTQAEMTAFLLPPSSDQHRHHHLSFFTNIAPLLLIPQLYTPLTSYRH